MCKTNYKQVLCMCLCARVPKQKKHATPDTPQTKPPFTLIKSDATTTSTTSTTKNYSNKSEPKTKNVWCCGKCCEKRWRLGDNEMEQRENGTKRCYLLKKWDAIKGNCKIIDFYFQLFFDVLSSDVWNILRYKFFKIFINFWSGRFKEINFG